VALEEEESASSQTSQRGMWFMPPVLSFKPYKNHNERDLIPVMMMMFLAFGRPQFVAIAWLDHTYSISLHGNIPERTGIDSCIGNLGNCNKWKC
jgi:hypothetical protein